MRYRFSFTSSLQHIRRDFQPTIKLHELFSGSLNIQHSEMELTQQDLHRGQGHGLIFFAPLKPTEERFPRSAIWPGINATLNPTHDRPRGILLP
jgi:hypothetical protein